MSKSIELPQLTIKALQDGATSFVVSMHTEYFDEFIKRYAPLQADDKDVVVKEEFQDNGYTGLIYKTDIAQDCFLGKDWQPASQMTKEQSRFNIDIEDVRVVLVQDLTVLGVLGLGWIVNGETWGTFHQDIEYHFNNLMQQYEDKHFTETGERISLGNYEDNPYVFLYDVKVTTKEFHKGTKDK